jgi:carboxypeptidase Taq
MSSYRALAQRFDRHYLLKSSADVLEWDAQAMMPAGGGDLRAAQLGTLRVLAHDAIAAPEMAELLAARVAGGATQRRLREPRAAAARGGEPHASDRRGQGGGHGHIRV